MNIKPLNEAATLPTKAHEHDAGFDLYTTHYLAITPGDIVQVPTGIAVQIPKGCVGLIKDRSSIAKKGIHIVGGVIDSGYTGELIILAHYVRNYGVVQYFKIGEKVAQLLVMPLLQGIEINVVEELEDSARGANGFGSSDHIVTNSNRTVQRLVGIGQAGNFIGDD